ncbi:Beta N-acetyl-glucosaminidase [Dissulfuribacter thermophilus]|uniref:beta-N-acetylhexosaminidase n=1 Tax=Dissulfuribacter thermophilus TaxID=1156395 RepID=A0A1B9F7L8_9BACT|nr:glycoside hydrolase family 3 N-terminal domain-containing protein [Dissulfuribacter thermophilus]OCC15844.1 Beta N-acetyl-glucosaminidase [Dissulfuribacter thermophilus]
MLDILCHNLCVGIPEEGLIPEFRSFLKEYRPGNFIVFKRNAKEGPTGLRDLIGELKIALKELKMPPPYVCVDQEGGRVSRLGSPHWPSLPSFSEIAQKADPQNAVKDVASLCAFMLKDVGINVNFSPCLDLKEDGAPVVMNERTFSKDPAEVATLGRIYLKTLQDAGILTVAKHFPGIGGINFDPHEDIAYSELNETRQKDALLPFKAAIEEQVFGVMTSHVLFPQYDPNNIVTFSKTVVDMLRKQLSFQGILFTDDLFMGAVRKHFGLGTSGALALRAGYDILLYCHDIGETARAIDELIKIIEDDDYIMQRLIESSCRILTSKQKFLE